MALTWIYEKQYTDSEALMQVENQTVYGGAEDDRNEGAEVLIAAHVDEDEVENFVTVDSTPYLTKTLYDIPNTIDGHYHIETLRFPIWSIATPYVIEVRDSNDIITTYASVVYYTITGKFYKCKLANTGQLPTNTTYYTEILDFTDSELRSSNKIVVGETDQLFDHRVKVCVKDELYRIISNSCNTEDVSKLLPYLKKKILLTGAQAKLEDAKPEHAEVIIRELSTYCRC